MASHSLARNAAEFNRRKMMDRRALSTQDAEQFAPANDDGVPDGQDTALEDSLAPEPTYASQQSPEHKPTPTTPPGSPAGATGQPLPQQSQASTGATASSSQSPNPGLNTSQGQTQPRQRGALNRGFNNIRFSKEQKKAYARIKQLRDANKKLEKKLGPIQRHMRPLEALKLVQETKRSSLIIWCAVLCLVGCILLITIFLFEVALVVFGVAGRIVLLIGRSTLKIKKLNKQLEPLEKLRSQIQSKQEENENKIEAAQRQIQIIKNRSFLSTQRSRTKEQQPS